MPGNWVDENFSYNAGDTFVLSAGIHYTYFSMANVHDVTFINEGGVATCKTVSTLIAAQIFTLQAPAQKIFMVLK
jgi:hypothetical protein